MQRKTDEKVCLVHQRKLSLLPWPQKAVAVLFVGEGSNSCKRIFPPHSTSHFSLVNQPWNFCLWNNLSNLITLNYEKMCDLKVGVASCVGQMSGCISLAKACALIRCCSPSFLWFFSSSWNCSCGRQKQDPVFWVLQSKDWSLAAGELGFFSAALWPSHWSSANLDGAWRLPRRAGGSWSSLPLPRRVCVVNMEGHQFYLGCEVWQGKSQGSSAERTFLKFAVGHSGIPHSASWPCQSRGVLC